MTVSTDPAAPAVDAPTDQPAVAVVTLGCGRNEVDTAQLQGMFDVHGHRVTDDPQDADVVLVNTCTFIAPAKQESVDTVLAACDLKDDGARAVVVVGCMAQRYPHELADSIPEADAVVGFGGYATLPQLVDRILAGEVVDRVSGVDAEPTTATPTAGAEGARSDRRASVGEPVARVRRSLPLLVMPTAPEEAPPERAPLPDVERVTTDAADLARMPASGPRFPVRTYDAERPWAYLKIAGGCDRMCTFCAIPSFRGGFSSRGIDELVAEAAWLAEQGARELVLVSENTTSWGKDLGPWNGHDGGRALAPVLLRELGAVDGIERLRLLYLQPDELQWPLLEAMAEVEQVVPYVDLSMQHVSADLLRSMARAGSPDRFLDLTAKIRELMPDVAFRSNFILGFPGETEDHVAELEQFLHAAQLDWVGFFPFSVEDGTRSATYDDQVPEEVAAERVERMTSIQEVIAGERAARWVGRRVAVLVEEVGEYGTIGRIPQQAPETDGEVRLELPGSGPSHPGAPDLPVGRIVDVEVTGAEGVDLVGRPVTGRVAPPGRADG